ncbi:MAG: glycosyltransferase family 4 protein [Ilumatobacteraceae bacterium]
MDSSVYEGLRVAVLSWRGPGDPDAGGSELHANEILSRWAQHGVEVTLFARTPPSATRPSTSPFSIVNIGSEYSVFARAAARVIRHRQHFDAVVEILNGVPFCSPLWWRGPKVVWLHHPHTEMWEQRLPFPLAQVGRWNESAVIPKMYRSTRVITLSEPGHRDLVAAGFNNVTAIEPGVSPLFCTPTEGSDQAPADRPFRLIAVGRLAPVKRWIGLLNAIEPLANRVALSVVGDGPLAGDLQQWKADHRADWLQLLGHVSDDDLVGHYQEADLLVSASSAEGWGMTITEAARCGTPAIATNVLGHSAAIVDDVTGELVATPNDLTDAIQRLVQDPERLRRYADAACRRASSLSWDDAATRHLNELGRLIT